MIKYLMRLFYANNNFAKHKISGGNYLVAVIGASFYLLITTGLFIVIIFSTFPNVYIAYLRLGINSTFFGLGYVLISCIILRLLTKEEEIIDDTLTRDYVEKRMNILIGYSIVLILVIGFLTLKYLGPIKNIMSKQGECIR